MKLRRGHGSVACHLVVASMLFLGVAGPAMAALPESTSLAGTQWQLVRIMSMDDSEYLPEAPSAYILVFDTEGRLLLPLGQLSDKPEPGRYSLITGITVDQSNYLYVLDQFFNKIDIFQKLEPGTTQAN